MKRLPIELLDEKGKPQVHYLQTPSYFGLQRVDELRQERADARGVDVMLIPASLDVMIAALLTDIEPMDANGYPVHYWTPPEVAKRIPMEEGAVDKLWDTVQALLEDAVPTADEKEGPERPTKAGSGGSKPPKPAKNSGA